MAHTARAYRAAGTQRPDVFLRTELLHASFILPDCRILRGIQVIERTQVRTWSCWRAAAVSTSLTVCTWLIPTAGLTAAASVMSGLELPASALSQEQQPANPSGELNAHPDCTVNLLSVGTMRDIVSNALTRGLRVPQRDVALFLDGAQDRYANGPELLKAAAAHFKMTEDVLAAKVEKYKHCNCKHPVERALHPQLRVDPHPHPECTVDLELAGTMSDILSSALLQELHVPERDVQAVLADAEKKYEDGPEVFKIAAVHFKMSEDALAAHVQKFRHCNCSHPGGGAAMAEVQQGDDHLPVSAFAKDVTLHVVLHELGHGLIREFDIPDEAM